MEYAAGDFLIGLNFLARVLQEPPSQQFLHEMRPLAGQIFAWPGASPDFPELMLKMLEKDSEKLATELAEEHLRLFTGPFPVVPLWESVWLENDGLLFGKKTLEAESLFLDWNVANDNPATEPLDHLGFELGLLAWLLELQENAPNSRSLSGKTPFEGISALLKGHILLYAPQVLEKIPTQAQTPFYRLVASNGLALLNTLASLPHP